MLYICIGKPRTSCKYRASSVSFYPDRPKNRPGEGATAGRIIFSKCFVVFSTCRIIFRRCFLVSPKQPADCSRRLKTLKLRALGSPDFPVGTRRGQGRHNPKGRRLHGPGPGQDNKAQAFHKEPAKGKKLGILILKCVFHFTKKQLSINFTYICRVK